MGKEQKQAKEKQAEQNGGRKSKTETIGAKTKVTGVKAEQKQPGKSGTKTVRAKTG